MLGSERDKIAAARAKVDELVAEGEQGEQLVDAQRELAAALDEVKMRELEERAQRERVARDTKLAKQREAYEAELEAETLKLEAQAELERTHRDAEIALQEQQFADDLERLKKKIANGHLTQEEGQAAIIELLESYGVDYGTAADLLGTTFADHMGGTITAAASAGGQIATALDDAVKAVRKAAGRMKGDLASVRAAAAATAAAVANSQKRKVTYKGQDTNPYREGTPHAKAWDRQASAAGAAAVGAASAIATRPPLSLAREVPGSLIPLDKTPGVDVASSSQGAGGVGPHTDFSKATCTASKTSTTASRVASSMRNDAASASRRTGKSWLLFTDCSSTGTMTARSGTR